MSVIFFEKEGEIYISRQIDRSSSLTRIATEQEKEEFKSQFLKFMSSKEEIEDHEPEQTEEITEKPQKKSRKTKKEEAE